MKRINNILSYLWLLLLLAVTACTDEGREVAQIHQGIQESDEVELTIQANVPEMKVASRTAPSEAINSITALAFDSDSKLIKVVKASLTDKQATSGNLKIKVPKRTQDIHFFAENNAEATSIDINIGDNVSTLLEKTSDKLYYWGKTTYSGNNNISVTLIRNMAKVTLTLGDGLTGTITGFLNYNSQGTLVPGDNFTIGTINPVSSPASHGNGNLGTEHYLFEHANEKNNNPLYAICNIGGKYYKIAFATSGSNYFDIIRNRHYRIVIKEIDTMYGETIFTDAVNSAYPINDVVKEPVLFVFDPQTLTIDNTAENTCSVRVTIPEGITNLKITSTTFTVTSNDASLSANQDGSYTVTGGSTPTFTFTLNNDQTGQTGARTITFTGNGKYKEASGEVTVTLVTPETPQDTYELWFIENNGWNGSTGYDTFFTKNGDITTGDAVNLEQTFYDTGADNHKSKHMVMGEGKSISFTIAEKSYLTLLVASNNTNPSINLFNNNGQPWTTSPDDANATTVKDTYNFGNGEINTDGRLIRYQLPAGTYTLQGSAVEYLLYYMRVTKVKPEMTDIVQPAASDYSLVWSGNNGGYLKDPNNNAKYFVDDNATTFDAKLSYQGLNNVSLSTMNLKVESLLHSFADQDQNGNNISPTDVTSNTESRSYNQISPTLAYNAGAYNLSGTINLGNESTYKYAAFYDVVQLKPVDFTVKNTIKVGLYHSWNEDATSITEYTNGLPYIVGFKMPPVLPNNVDVNNNTVSPIVFTIDSNWKVQSSGLGVEANNGNYQLTSQNQTNNDTQYQRVHPRPNWNYKIQWESVVSNDLTPTLTNVNENKDIYFSYNGTITKNPFIATSISSDKLDIALDFYQTENENKPNGTTYNLDFTNDSFYLKATISQTDAAKYAGAQVNLQGEFTSESGGGHDAIHWWNSRQGGNSSIGYDNNNNGTGLRFTIQEGQTEYKIEWKFVRPNDSQSTDPVQFTYTVKNDLYNMTGDTNATIILGGNQAGGNTNEPKVIFNLDFSDGKTINGWGNENNKVSREIGEENGNKYLVLISPNASFAQAAVDATDVNLSNYATGNYTLTFKVRGANNSGQIKEIVFQDKNNNYAKVSTSHINISYSTVWQTVELNFTINSIGNRFLIDYSDYQARIYIDDLKLVKND